MLNDESGWVPPYIPPDRRDGLRKCPECGAVFVGTVLYAHACKPADQYPAPSSNFSVGS